MLHKNHYDYKFIDIHCHILNGIDDGAKNIEQSLEMLEIAMKENIGAICLTPHFRAGVTSLGKDILLGKYRDFVLVVKERFPETEIYLGNELFYNDDLHSALDQGLCATINGGNYILVEFNPGCEFFEVKRGLSRLINGGYKPILAHIERYMCLMDQMSRIDEITHMGGYLQVNANTITKLGLFGRGAWIKKLLKKNYIHFVATDCHNTINRAPMMLECADVLSRYGLLYTKQLLHDNPLRVLKDENI